MVRYDSNNPTTAKSNLSNKEQQEKQVLLDKVENTPSDVSYSDALKLSYYQNKELQYANDKDGINRDLLIGSRADEMKLMRAEIDNGSKKFDNEIALEMAQRAVDKKNNPERGYELFDANEAEKKAKPIDPTEVKGTLAESEKLTREKKYIFPAPEGIKKADYKLLSTSSPGVLKEDDNDTSFTIKDINPITGKEYDKNTDLKTAIETRSKTYNDADGAMIPKYLLKDDKLDSKMEGIFTRSGLGGREMQFAMWMKYIDRYQLNIVPHNTETSDITLITRPSLPMSSSNLRTDPFLVQFDTDDPTSVSHAIRCLLDKEYTQSPGSNSSNSLMFNPYSPWLTPVVNGLVSITGFPDPMLETETTEGGYHQEDQTYVKGGLGLYRSQQLQLNFKDVQGGPLMSLFLVWITIMAHLRDGKMVAYMKHIDRNIVPYSVGIYHFNLDPTKQFITNWAKCTLCFPLTAPYGSLMNKSENQRYIQTAGEFSIPFLCNFFHYRHLTDLRAFNILAERYYPNIGNAPIIPPGTAGNYMGLPFILYDEEAQAFRLVYKQVPDPRQK